MIIVRFINGSEMLPAAWAHGWQGCWKIMLSVGGSHHMTPPANGAAGSGRPSLFLAVAEDRSHHKSICCNGQLVQLLNFCHRNPQHQRERERGVTSVPATSGLIRSLARIQGA